MLSGNLATFKLMGLLDDQFTQPALISEALVKELNMFLRRRFLQVSAVSALAAGASTQEGWTSSTAEKSPQQLDAELTKILSEPVLRLDHVKEKVTITS